MARYGSGVPWHRVVRAPGRLAAAGHEAEAPAPPPRRGTPLTAGGTRIDMPRARWWPDPDAPG